MPALGVGPAIRRATARRGLFVTALVTRVPQCRRLHATVTIAIAVPAVTRVAESTTVAQP